MSITSLSPLIVAATVLSLTGCIGDSVDDRVARNADSASATAASGRSSRLPSPDSTDLSRVVSVSKQINEYIYAIGAQDHLVAVDLTSVYPPAIRELPNVGYHRALSAEGITSMRPTLFLTDGNVGPDAVLDLVRKVGVPILVLEPGSTPDSAQLLLRDLGTLFGREAAADSVLRVWQRDRQAALADTVKYQANPRPRVLFMHFGQVGNSYLGVGPQGAAGSVLRWAGGTNVLDAARMTRLTPELIARLRPDVIIATEVGFDRVGSTAAFAKLPGVELTPAARNGRIYRIEEDKIMYFGPRTPAAIREVADMLHANPEAAGQPLAP
jgi:iron complex transport system substrate-binding protein